MKALILVPTYNERENLPILAAGLMALANTEMLVIDDGSPDGTGEIAERLRQGHPGRVHVMHRTGSRGLGRSYLDGFRLALASDADIVCQMDADLSHDPKFLPAMFGALATGADLVIGSRYREGGGVENWPMRRVMLSAFRFPLLASERVGKAATRRDHLRGLRLSHRSHLPGCCRWSHNRRSADRFRRAPTGCVEALGGRAHGIAENALASRLVARPHPSSTGSTIANA
jgi:glycosyltransferase involved in cell wall biosynthesis